MRGAIRLKREHIGHGGMHRFLVNGFMVHLERTGPDEIGIAFWPNDLEAPPPAIDYSLSCERFPADEDKEQVKEAASQADQEEPFEGPDGVAPPCDGRVGSAGPLPDAGPEQVEVVEGVASDAQVEPASWADIIRDRAARFERDEKARREVALLLQEGRDAWLHLEDVVWAATEAGVTRTRATSGTLSVTGKRFTATCVWTTGGVAVATLAMRPGGELEDD